MTATQVINFAIAPYSDAVATKINSLSEPELYGLFSQPLSGEILTAALFSISRREGNLRQQLENGNYDSIRSWVVKDATQQCMENQIPFERQLSPEILRGLKLAHLRDTLLFGNSLNQLTFFPNVFLMVIDGIYAGHVYAWTRQRVTNIVGMRSSLHQLLKGRCGLKTPQLTSVFLNAIDQWTSSRIDDSDRDLNQRDHYLRYLQPSGKLISILNRCGFRLALSSRRDYDRDWAWFFDEQTLGLTPLTAGLLFREYDYFIPLNAPRTCAPGVFAYHEVVA